MEKKSVKYYENYPLWIVFLSNILQILIYLIGAFIIYQLGWSLTIVYLIIVFLLEIKLIKGHCVNCYYYGKRCAFGKGKLSCLFFKKGNAKNFCKKIGWKDIVPDFLISLIPAVIGIRILIIKFNWIILILVILLILLTFSGNAFVRSHLACKYCKQRKIGCPAENLFNNKKGGEKWHKHK